MTTREYRICTKCVMDTSNPDIEFDANGVCNHCKEYEDLVRSVVVADREEEVGKLINRIKKQGRGKKYDSILGLSGGLDSTYVAYLAGQFGLRPLIVTVDNGWDDERAKSNVKNAAEKLGFDLHHYVIDWNEFRDLQISFLKASVVDIEMISDQGILGYLFKMANQERVKYILSGGNVVTEGIRINSWTHDKNDLTNVKAIHKQFGKVRLKTLPTLGMMKLLYYYGIKGIKYTNILNYVPYARDKAKEIVTRELGWIDYGAKHHESIWTRFYQTYILPRKFGIDKRRAHLSTLIYSGQITRDEALKEMEKPPCSEDLLNQDKKYVLEKMGLTEAEFEEIMNLPIKSHDDYKSNRTWRFLRSVQRRRKEHKKRK